VSQPLAVIVAGASSGFGAALAEDLAAAGHQVVAGARRTRPSSPRLRYLPVDVTDAEAVERFAAAAVGELGRVDGGGTANEHARTAMVRRLPPDGTRGRAAAPAGHDPGTSPGCRRLRPPAAAQLAAKRRPPRMQTSPVRHASDLSCPAFSGQEICG